MLTLPMTVKLRPRANRLTGALRITLIVCLIEQCSCVGHRAHPIVVDIVVMAVGTAVPLRCFVYGSEGAIAAVQAHAALRQLCTAPSTDAAAP